MRGRKNNDATKAAVMAALLAGQSISEVARNYKLPISTIFGIKKEINSIEFEEVRNKKQDEFATLITDVLRTMLVTVRSTLQFCQDKSWFDKQEAAQVATLIGVTTDKAIRILEAAQYAEPESEQAKPA